ncbi:Putative ribonuclease H protein [Arachis hypogaea]|nr:Putative ribonuclease H protein [Arachis hypogaea]
MLVRWVPPSEGTIKLNVDGSSRGNPGRVRCGGLLRDQDVNCIAVFVSYIGFAGSVEVELMAIRHGLWLAWQFGYRKVECESDCMVALKIIHDNAEDFPEFAHIVEEIHQFMLLSGTSLSIIS